MIKNLYYKNKETTHNFFWRSLQILSKEGITFLIFFMAARFLIPFDFGILNYLMAVLALLMIFCDFGVSSATSKYVAEYKAKKSEHLNKILFSVSIIIIGLATLISLFVIFLGKGIFKENYLYIIYFLPYLFLVPLTSVADGVYRGLKEFKKLALISSIAGIISLGISYFLIKNFLLIGVIFSQNILYLLLVIFLFVFQKNFEFKIDKFVLKKILRYSLILGFATISYYLLNKVDILILKYFDYVVEIGYYEILNKLFQVFIIPFIIMGQILAPNITEKYINKDFIDIKKRFQRHLFFSLSLALIISILLYFLIPLIIKLLFNEYFVPQTIHIFSILLFVIPIRMVAAVISQAHVIATGNAHYMLITMIFGGIANIVLDFILILKYGFIGVIYATLICFIFTTVAYVILYYSKLNKLVLSKIQT